MRTSGLPKPLFRLVVVVALALAAIVLYGIFIEPRRITVTEVTIRRGDLAQALDGRRAALLSDPHFHATGGDSSRRILAALDRIAPDIIFLTGDFVRWGGRSEAYEEALAFLESLRAPLGVFAVTGDADTTYSRKSCEFCHEPGSGARTQRHGVTFLRDSLVSLKTAKGEVTIAGVDGYSEYDRDAVPAQLLSGDRPLILLSHSSTVYGAIDPSREALVLSGDTHGGQVLLPEWFWRITRRKPDADHFHGFYRDGRKSLFVTRGLGTSWPHLRLGEPPEIAVLMFRAGEDR